MALDCNIPPPPIACIDSLYSYSHCCHLNVIDSITLMSLFWPLIRDAFAQILTFILWRRCAILTFIPCRRWCFNYDLYFITLVPFILHFNCFLLLILLYGFTLPVIYLLPVITCYYRSLPVTLYVRYYSPGTKCICLGFGPHPPPPFHPHPWIAYIRYAMYLKIPSRTKLALRKLMLYCILAYILSNAEILQFWFFPIQI